ncbi:MAG TPA: DUF4442 domain-containing protein [Deltaproteobacteria bacterium]|nr:DUF4442 domain-containing protein [Deltaproteobacteria bacterium]
MIDEKFRKVVAYNENGIEGIRRTGVKILEMRDRYVKLMMPLKGNVNHVNIMYAGSLFSLGEMTGGVIFFAAFDYMNYHIVAKEVNIRFRRPAVTDVTVTAEISEEAVRNIAEEMTEKGKADIILDLELKDAKPEVVALVHGVWQGTRNPEGFIVPW